MSKKTRTYKVNDRPVATLEIEKIAVDNFTVIVTNEITGQKDERKNLRSDEEANRMGHYLVTSAYKDIIRLPKYKNLKHTNEKV